MTSGLLDSLRQAAPGLETGECSGNPAAGCSASHVCPSAQVPSAARAFKEAGYLLEMLTCLDRRARGEGFQIIYHFSKADITDRHRLRAGVSPGEEPPSLAELFESANWYEREVYDMFGVRFAGHPDMTRILTEEGADYHPLLKDFGVAPPGETGDGDA